jgi:hypothetical protein
VTNNFTLYRFFLRVVFRFVAAVLLPLSRLSDLMAACTAAPAAAVAAAVAAFTHDSLHTGGTRFRRPHHGALSFSRGQSLR